ncbi:unnamed protein product [Caenorhabditis auriculariae]|uniref:DUF281 domain-containing protein n=1 Tax=Caenorhabditis auriculariae TaxID=2777116 RepID=A0A8S1HZU8_9PELO|nr:unnamed protein product [Caenorhabditis auriculariae]
MRRALILLIYGSFGNDNFHDPHYYHPNLDQLHIDDKHFNHFNLHYVQIHQLIFDFDVEQLKHLYFKLHFQFNFNNTKIHHIHHFDIDSFDLHNEPLNFHDLEQLHLLHNVADYHGMYDPDNASWRQKTEIVDGCVRMTATCTAMPNCFAVVSTISTTGDDFQMIVGSPTASFPFDCNGAGRLEVMGVFVATTVLLLTFFFVSISPIRNGLACMQTVPSSTTTSTSTTTEPPALSCTSCSTDLLTHPPEPTRQERLPTLITGTTADGCVQVSAICAPPPDCAVIFTAYLLDGSFESVADGFEETTVPLVCNGQGQLTVAGVAVNGIYCTDLCF